MYHIVCIPSKEENFPDEVKVIHDRWILEDKKSCVFPPFMRSKLKKAVKTGLRPDSNWKTYRISRILDSYDTFKMAYDKLYKAQLTSNLDSDDSIQEITVMQRTKKPLIHIDSDSEEDIPTKKKKLTALPLSPGVKCLLSEANTSVDEFSANTSVDLLADNSLKYASPAFVKLEKIAKEPSDSNCQTPSIPGPSQTKATPFEEYIIKWMTSLEKKIDENNLLLRNVLVNIGENLVDTNIIESLPKLPASSLEQCAEIENYIEDPENFKRMVLFLSTKGGQEVAYVTRRIMKNLLSYDLACQYNWAGRGEKRAFKDLKMRRLVIDAVRENKFCKNADEKAIEDSIKAFLKYAPLRCKYNSSKGKSTLWMNGD